MKNKKKVESGFLPKDYQVPEIKPYAEWKDRYCDKIQDQEYKLFGYGSPRGREE